jgi:hypothetical protein
MAEFKAGDKIKVKDRPGWPGGYKIAGWTGEIVKVHDNPKGYVSLKADKTGYVMLFAENEIDRA